MLQADWTLRLASLALAGGLWFVIAGKQTAERGVSVPVELRNVPRDLELTGDPVNAVDVRVRASPGLINSLEAGKVLATIDLAGASEGERIVQLTAERIQVPFGFVAAKALIRSTNSSGVSASRRSTLTSWKPPSVKWVWANHSRSEIGTWQIARSPSSFSGVK